MTKILQVVNYKDVYYQVLGSQQGYLENGDLVNEHIIYYTLKDLQSETRQLVSENDEALYFLPTKVKLPNGELWNLSMVMHYNQTLDVENPKTGRLMFINGLDCEVLWLDAIISDARS